MRDDDDDDAAAPKRRTIEGTRLRLLREIDERQDARKAAAQLRALETGSEAHESLADSLAEAQESLADSLAEADAIDEKMSGEIAIAEAHESLTDPLAEAQDSLPQNLSPLPDARSTTEPQATSEPLAAETQESLPQKLSDDGDAQSDVMFHWVNGVLEKRPVSEEEKKK